MEVVINRCFGRFKLSNKAIERYFELKGQKVWFYRELKLGSHEYVRADSCDNSYTVRPYSQDFGDKVSKDINKYSLYSTANNIERNDPVLVKVVKELGEEANCATSDLQIVEIPDDVNWEIEDYDGMESVEEVHRSWH